MAVLLLRRAKRLEDAEARLYAEAAAVREEMLASVCLRLRRLLDAREGGEALPPDTAEALERIHRQVAGLPAFTRRASRPRAREEDLDDLWESVRRFHRRWEDRLDGEGTRALAILARQTEAHNRCYPEERRAALRYVAFSRLRFDRMEPPTRADLVARLPFLPAPWARACNPGVRP